MESEIQEIETLLKKRKWNEVEHEASGSKDQTSLREKQRLLLEKENQLLKTSPSSALKPCVVPFLMIWLHANEVGADLIWNHVIPYSKK